MKEQINSIKQQANTQVRELEEYIQQEATLIKERVKKLETTIVQQMEVIDRQNEEIENMVKKVTQEMAHVAPCSGTKLQPQVGKPLGRTILKGRCTTGIVKSVVTKQQTKHYLKIM